jgi:hypothetical protein
VDGAATRWTGRIAWTRVRGPRLLSTVAKVGLLASFVAVFVTKNPVVMALAGVGFLAPCVLWPVSYLLSLTRRVTPGWLEVTPDYITVADARGERLVSRRRIVGALVVDRRIGVVVEPRVEIELDDGDRVAFRPDDLAEARAIVEALGFGPRGRRVRSRLGRPMARALNPLLASVSNFFAFFVVILGAAALAPRATTDSMGGIIVLSLIAVTSVFYAFAVRAARQPEAVVGDDSVRLERGFGSRLLRLGDPLGLERRALVDQERRVAVERLAAERARLAPPAERRELFAREGSSIAEWRSRLEAAIGGGSYRGAPLSLDDARATLGCPEASPEQRVGAAMALRVAGQPELVRVAVDNAADGRVRVALEAALEDDATGVERALGKIARRA